MAASLGSLVVSLGLDAAEFVAGLSKAQYEAQQFRERATKHFNDIGVAMNLVKGAVAGVAGALSVSMFTGLFTDAIKAAAALDDLAEKTGVSVESLSQLQEVARVGGHNFESVTGAVTKLNKSLAEVYNPASKASLAFAQIGLSAKDLQGIDAGEALQKIAKQLAGFSDAGPGKAAFAIAVLGKAGAEALPFIKDLGEATDLFTTTTAKSAAEAEEFEKDLKRLSFAKQELIRTITNAMVPALDDLIKGFLDSQREAKGFRSQVQELSNDGSLQRWFQDLAVGIATAYDALRTWVDAFKLTVDLAITGAQQIAGLARVFGGASQVISGFVADGTENVKAGYEAMTAAGKKWVANLDDVVKRESLADKVRKNIADRQIRDQGPQAPARPILGFKGGQDKLGPLDDPSKKILEGQLKELDASIQAEKQLLSARDEFLNAYYAHGDIALQRFYDLKADAQQQDIEKTRAALGEEQRLLQARIALPTRVTPQGPGITEVDREDAKNKLIEVTKRLSAAEFDASVKSAKSELDRIFAAEQYKNTLQELNAQTLDLAGNTEAAAKIRFDIQNQQLRRQLTVNGDKGALAQVDAIGKQREVQAALNDEQKKFSLITEGLSIAQERVNLLQSTGAISEIEALNSTSELNKARIADLTKIADAYALIAAQSQDPADLLKVQRLRLEIEKLSASTDLLGQKFNNIFTSSLSSFFEDIIGGTKSVGQAFRDMGRSIEQSITKLISEDLSKRLFKSIFGDSSTGGVDLGGLLSGLFKPSEAAPIDFGAFLADGGTPPMGKVSIVGERGPELFVPNAAGKIIPNDVLMGKRAARDGAINISINVPNGTSRASADQIAAAAGAAVARATRRNG